MKTLAIRMEDEQHARLSILAKLSGDTITDVLRTAIDDYITTASANPEVSARAEDLTAAIDREAAEQRAAIATLFGPKTPPSRAGRPKSQ